MTLPCRTVYVPENTAEKLVISQKNRNQSVPIKLKYLLCKYLLPLSVCSLNAEKHLFLYNFSLLMLFSEINLTAISDVYTAILAVMLVSSKPIFVSLKLILTSVFETKTYVFETNIYIFDRLL